MSTITYCDGDDCYNTQEDTKIYSLNWATRQPEDFHKMFGLLSKYDDICKECVEMYNEDYTDENGNKKFIEDELGVLIINHDYTTDKE